MHLTPDNPLTNVYRHSALAPLRLALNLLFLCTADALPHNLSASTSTPTLVKRRQNSVTLKQNLKKKRKKNLPQIRIASEEESVTVVALESMKLFASGQKLKPRGAERYCTIVKCRRWPICGCVLARKRMRAVPFDSTPR